MCVCVCVGGGVEGSLAGGRMVVVVVVLGVGVGVGGLSTRYFINRSKWALTFQLLAGISLEDGFHIAEDTVSTEVNGH